MSLFQIIIYHNISDRIAGMSSASVGVGAGASDLYFYQELSNTPEGIHRTNAIQEYLFTKIISPRRLLLECMRVHLLSIPQQVLLNDDLEIDDVMAFTSFGNHATIVCACPADVGSRERRIIAILEGEVLESVRDVTTIRSDQAVGVAQPVFNHAIDRFKELFVLGKDNTDIRSLIQNWSQDAWASFTDSIMNNLNVNGINQGRIAFKEKLKVLFEKIRTLKDDDPKTHELRKKYSEMAMDLLRNDLFRSFGSTIQKGVLATINIHNSSDEYTRHHGKPVFPGSAIEKAAYNLLILVNVVIGGFVYTIHMEIDREAVKELLFHASTHDRKMGDDKYQSVSYWIGDVIKWIHENKNEFFSIVKEVLDKSFPNVTGVAPQIGYQHKNYLLEKMDDMVKKSSHGIPLNHAIFVSGCKCFTLYHPSIFFRNADDAIHSNRNIIVTTPNTDMTVGIYGSENFVSIKPITVTTQTPLTAEITITDVNFTPDPRFFHVPTYNEHDELLKEVFKPSEGDTFGSFPSSYTPGPESLDMQAEVRIDATAIESRAAAKAEAVAKAEAAAKADLEMKPVVDKLIQEIKVDITKPMPDKTPQALVEGIVSQERSRPGILKQALNTICGTFHYLLSPFTSLQRLGVVIPHTILANGHNSHNGTELLDPDTAMRISVVLMCALKFDDVVVKSIIPYQTELDAAQTELAAAQRAFDDAKREFHAEPSDSKPVKRRSKLLVPNKSRSIPDPHYLEEDEEEQDENGEHKMQAERSPMQIIKEKVKNVKSRMKETEQRVKYFQSLIIESQTALSDNFKSVENIMVPNVIELESLHSVNPVYKQMIYDREDNTVLLQAGGMRRRTLRRGVKKNTRRERRDRSIRSRRCRRRDCRDCWQYSRSSSKLNKNTQRCRSRNSKTRRRRRNPNRQ